MIGDGTITQSILIGEKIPGPVAILVIFIGIVISFVTVISLKFIRDQLSATTEGIFDKYVNILSRINGLIIGSVSTDMIVSGIHKLWVVE
jgi:small neutral amino acid transporter SnatA (MarC family)